MGLKTVLVKRYAIGGQAGSSSLIENYMGFPEGISGAELAERARQQAQKFGLDILLLREGVRGAFVGGLWHAGLADGEKLVAKANICATGIEYRKLNLPREAEFLHKGVYYGGGMSEACFCGGKDVVVVGGGNSASRWLEVAKMFICIGGLPNTEWANGTDILRNSRGYLITGADLWDCPGFAERWTRDRHPFALETSVPGMPARAGPKVGGGRRAVWVGEAGGRGRWRGSDGGFAGT